MGLREQDAAYLAMQTPERVKAHQDQMAAAEARRQYADAHQNDDLLDAKRLLANQSLNNHIQSTLHQAGLSGEERAGVRHGSLEPVGAVQSAWNSLKDTLR